MSRGRPKKPPVSTTTRGIALPAGVDPFAPDFRCACPAGCGGVVRRDPETRPAAKLWCDGCEWWTAVAPAPAGAFPRFVPVDLRREEPIRDLLSGRDVERVRFSEGLVRHRCAAGGCGRPARQNGMCMRHYTRWRFLGRLEGSELQAWLAAGGQSAPPREAACA